MISDTKTLASSKKQSAKINQKYQEYFLDEKIKFFRLLTFTISIASFLGLLFFIIQQQVIELIIFTTLICVINLILTFFLHRCKKYLVHIFAQMYMFSVAITSILIRYGTEVPQFVLGFSTGILFSVLIQFCDTRAKYFFFITTPWIYLILAKNFSLLYIHYTLFVIITCTLLGFFSYLHDSKQKQIFNQNNKIEQQLQIIRHFTNDYLFAISYDGKQRQFKLEFTNLSFENSFPEDIKEFLRLYKVQSDPDSENQKKNTKLETLEEFLFELYKNHDDLETNQYFDKKVKNKLNDKLFEMKISRIFIQQQIFVLAIKASVDTIHFEKYENRIINLKESLISLSTESGSYLQSIYKSLNKVQTSTCVNIQDICEKQQSNILYLLNRMKNYLIYYQREKLQLISQTIDRYKLSTFLNALIHYFQIKSSQRKQIFTSLKSLNFDQDLIVRVNQKLLAQILVNVFHVILDISSTQSIIKISVTQEEQSNSRKHNYNSNFQQINTDQVKSQEEFNHETIQFKFSFLSDKSIQDIDKLFSRSQIIEQKNNEDANQIIASSVNNIILQMIGPYNQIQLKSNFDNHFHKFLNEVSFSIYTDQSKLDPSYTKHIQLEKQIFQIK